MTYNYFDHHDSMQGLPQDDEHWQTLMENIDMVLGDDTLSYLQAADIPHSLSNDMVGRCLNLMCDCPHAPFEVSVWSGEKSPPRVYQIRRR